MKNARMQLLRNMILKSIFENKRDDGIRDRAKLYEEIQQK
jgi:hypothetical protein